MRLDHALVAVLLAAACSDDGGQTTETGMLDSGSGPTTAPTSGDGSSATAGSGPVTGTADATGGTGDESGTGVQTSDTGPGGAGPTLLYDGPVAGGTVPGWNPDDPRALIMLASLGADTWIATLARIGDDGSLSDNAAPQILVWGWETEPPQLYDGPVVGGAIPGWSADDPMPVVMAAYLDADASWTTSLASIAADGSLGDNFADRIIVWGWSGPVPGAPSVQYSGPITGGQLDGWDPAAPQPLVMGSRFSGEQTWQSTLVSIGPGGGLRGNVADELLVWGW